MTLYWPQGGTMLFPTPALLASSEGAALAPTAATKSAWIAVLLLPSRFGEQHLQAPADRNPIC